MSQWAAHTDARGYVRVNLWRTLKDQTLASAACSTDPDPGGLWRRRIDTGTGNETSHNGSPGHGGGGDSHGRGKRAGKHGCGEPGR